MILAGDHRQHASVEAGDALRLLEEKSGLRVARVKKVVRQRRNVHYKQAITALSAGDTKGGFKKLEKMGCVVEIEDAAKREQRIAEDYLRSVTARRSAIVVAPTHAEGKRIARAIRTRLKTARHLDVHERTFTNQRDLSLTEAEKLDATVYREGMTIQFHQNVCGGFRAGEKYEVTGRQQGKITLRHSGSDQLFTLDPKHGKNYSVYQKGTINLSKGETIRISANGRTREKNRISNGQIYQVVGFTKDGHLRLSNGKTLDKDYRNFQYGYTRTSHSVQGRDAQDVLIAQSAISFPASNDKQFYVSTSRGVETCRVYTDDKEALRQAVQRSGDRLSAQELRREQQEQIKQRTRFYTRQIKNKFRDEPKNARQPKKQLSPTKDARIR